MRNLFLYGCFHAMGTKTFDRFIIPVCPNAETELASHRLIGVYMCPFYILSNGDPTDEPCIKLLAVAFSPVYEHFYGWVDLFTRLNIQGCKQNVFDNTGRVD